MRIALFFRVLRLGTLLGTLLGMLLGMLGMLLGSPSSVAGQDRRLCQGRLCWPEGPRPPWLDRARASLDGMELPVLDGGHLRARATLFAPTGLDPATCALTETWRGRRLGAHGRREPIEGQATSSGVASVAPGDGGVVATFVVDALLPGARLAVESFAQVACGGVSFSLSSTDNVVATPDIQPLLCALHPPRGTPATVHVRLPERVRNVRLGARFGVLLRRRGLVLFDACSGHTVVDLATLPVPVADVGVPEAGTWTARDRALALWGEEYASDRGSGVVRSFHGFNGDWLRLTLAREPTPAELVRLRAIFAAARPLAWVDTMDDVPQPGDPAEP